MMPPGRRRLFPLGAAWLAFWLVWAAGCSQQAGPPAGAFGVRFGEAPAAGLAPLPLPLPADLGERLRFYGIPGRTDTFCGLSLADPVLAFFDGRLFSIAASATGDGKAAAPARLTERYGSPYCQEAAGVSTCLWKSGEVDIVFEEGGDAPARLMLRRRPEAEAVAAARPGGLSPESAGGVEGASSGTQAPPAWRVRGE